MVQISWLMGLIKSAPNRVGAANDGGKSRGQPEIIGGTVDPDLCRAAGVVCLRAARAGPAAIFWHGQRHRPVTPARTGSAAAAFQGR